MAESEELNWDKVNEKFINYCTLFGPKDKPTKINSSVCKKLSECIKLKGSEYKSINVSNMIDASVLSAMAGNAKVMEVKSDTPKKFIERVALEAGKRRFPKKDDIGKAQEAADALVPSIAKCIQDSDPKLKGTGTSSRGNVAGLTDSSGYTGSHKLRFDKDGKGKGVDGRKDTTQNSGYVGNYKGDGTYDSKK